MDSHPGNIYRKNNPVEDIDSDPHEESPYILGKTTKP
jgi:hypothetical protein